MRKTPGWYDEAIERHARLISEEGESQEAALVSLRMLVRDEHREFGNIILDDWNAPRLTTAVAALRSRRAAEVKEALRRAEAQAVAQHKAAAAAVPKPPAAPRIPLPRIAPDSAHPVDRPAPDPFDEITRQLEDLDVSPEPVPAPPVPAQDAKIEALRKELADLEPPTDPEWELHHTLFPDFRYRTLKAAYKVTPTKEVPVHKMTRHDLEMARNILFAKTQNAIEGAEQERRDFDALYNKVHPLMRDGDTVADAERVLMERAKSGSSTPQPRSL